MKLMIDIPEEDYIRLRDEGMFGNVTTFKRAVRKGVPLDQEPCTDAISRQAVLMEIDKYLCGVPFEKGIDKVIKELPPVKPAEKEEVCTDAISREDALMALTGEYTDSPIEILPKAIKRINKLPPVTPQPNKWIPVKWHTITDEEREREGYPEEWVNHVDCVMPADEQEILITVKNRKGRLWVEKDTCYVDDGFYLDSGYDWVDDVVAWCELPEPYKASPAGAESEDKEGGTQHDG